jgi:hypothetical protein
MILAPMLPSRVSLALGVLTEPRALLAACWQPGPRQPFGEPVSVSLALVDGNQRTLTTQHSSHHARVKHICLPGAYAAGSCNSQRIDGK